MDRAASRTPCGQVKHAAYAPVEEARVDDVLEDEVEVELVARRDRLEAVGAEGALGVEIEGATDRVLLALCRLVPVTCDM